MHILVTGGAGFIGSNFIHYMLRAYTDVAITNFDCLTYAGNLENLRTVEKDARYRFVRGDIAEAGDLTPVIAGGRFDAIVHFAAESHVDRSLHMGVDAFIRTNILGTQRLLDLARAHKVPRFVHVSTDEVYGSIEGQGRFTENSPIQPNNPYAATKAAADCMVRAAANSHNLDTIITRCSNNYGPYQFPEKLIPLMITNALNNQPLPVYGDGRQVRDWIFVDDHCHGVDLAMRHGRAGGVYNIGGMYDVPNLEVVEQILHVLNKPLTLIKHVPDRPGHDRRYAIDTAKISAELGWTPQFDFRAGLQRTVEWYLANREWWEHIRSGAYRDYYRKMYRT